MNIQKAFTMAGAGQGTLSTGLRTCGHAFTMAEILLSLTIIGVVAAITLPSLTGNINERTWNTQRKALYARMSQAISLMPALNGYGTLTAGDSSTSAVDTATETFLTDGLSKVLKINNICDSEHLEDCGIVSKISDMKGNQLDTPKTLVALNDYFNKSIVYSNGISMSYSQIDTRAAAFETVNGESILTFYSPNCVGAQVANRYYQAKMCANFIYDLNGNKGPNTVGKDIGIMTVFYPSDSVVVAPVPLASDTASLPHSSIAQACRDMDDNSRAPNLEEAASLFVNKYILPLEDIGNDYWTSTYDTSDRTKAYLFSMYGGWAISYDRDTSKNTRCIKR